MMSTLISVLCLSMCNYECYNIYDHVLPCAPEHIVMATDYHTDWYACKWNNLKTSPPVLTVVPRLSCDFVALSHKHSLFLLSKSTGAETVCPVRDMTVWVMCSYVGVLSSSLCLWPTSPVLQAKTLSISSHYPVTWNQRAKKPRHLLRLLNESNFLPESTYIHRNLNYLTLIQINKSHCHQDCAATIADVENASISLYEDNNLFYNPKYRINKLI